MDRTFTLIADFLENPLLFILLSIIVICLFLIYFTLEDKLEEWLKHNRKSKNLKKLKKLFLIISILCFSSSLFVPPVHIPKVLFNMSEVPLFTILLIAFGIYFHYFRKKVTEIERQSLSPKERKKAVKKEEKAHSIGCLGTILIIVILTLIGCFI